MQKDYYQQYYEIERKHWWFQVRNEIIINLVRDLAGKKRLKILNVGVATGYSTELLMEFGEVTSVEYDKDCYEFLKGFLPGKLLNASITELPFENDQYDLVCALDVIEHVEQDQLAVDELNRVCAVDGVMVVTVPAYNFLWSEHDIVNHHIRRYTRRGLMQLFSRNKIVYSSYFNSILFFPVALFRITKTAIFGKPKTEFAKSDFKSVKPTLFSKILKSIFSGEKPLLNRRVVLPFGVSIILASKKAGR